MIHQQDRIAVSNQIPHHIGQPHDIGRVQSDGRLVQHIEDTGCAVAHGSGQLHPLALSGGKRGGRPVQRKIAQAQIHQPLGYSLEGCADTFRHRTHLHRQGGGDAVHPLCQFRQGHLAGGVQGDAPQLGHTGRVGQPCTAAAGADVLLQKLFYPFHALLILYFGQGIFHGISSIKIGEVHVPRRAAGFVLIDDVLFDSRTVEHDVPLLVGQFPERNVRAHPYLPCNVLHQ